MAGISVIPKELVELLLKGDPRCKHPIGSQVMKMDTESGDLHTPGVQGKVIGSIYSEELEMDSYLVLFGDDPAPTFLAGKKLMSI